MKLFNRVKKYVRNAYLYVGLAVASVILHNVVSAIIKTEEPVFLFLTFVFLIAFIVTLFYNLLYLSGKK